MSLIGRLCRAGIHLEAPDDGQLVADGALTDERVSFLRAHKAELVEAVRSFRCGICRQPGVHPEHRCLVCDEPGHLACRRNLEEQER